MRIFRLKADATRETREAPEVERVASAFKRKDK
jgi:hypothetical protein